MTELSGILSLLLWVAGVAVLAILDKKQVDFTWRAPLALVLGMVIVPITGGSVVSVLALGRLYVRVLLLLTVPLVLCNAITVLWRLCKAVQSRGILALLLLQTLLAAGLATAGACLTCTGSHFTAAGTNWSQGTGMPGWLAALLLLLVLLVHTLRHCPRQNTSGNALAYVNQMLKSAFSTMVHQLPYAILALGMNLSQSPLLCGVVPLLVLLLLTAFFCALHLFVVNSVLLLLGGCKPILFFRSIFPAMRTAFLTQSGSETMPLAQTLLTDKVHVPPALASLTGSLGTKLGMPGCAAIWPVTLALFAAHATGTIWTPLQYGQLLLATVVISVVTMGIPGTSMITPLVLFLVMGLPPELMVVQLSVSGLADMARTPTNVVGASAVAVLHSRRHTSRHSI